MPIKDSLLNIFPPTHSLRQFPCPCTNDKSYDFNKGPLSSEGRKQKDYATALSLILSKIPCQTKVIQTLHLGAVLTS